MIDLPGGPSCHLGFGVVHEALRNVSEKAGTTLAKMLMSGLGCQADIDISKEFLRLVCGLVEKAPGLGMKKRLVGELVEAGVNRILGRMIGSIKNMEILVECRRYQSIRFKMLDEETKLSVGGGEEGEKVWEKLLEDLWDNSFPKKKIDSVRGSTEWSKLGFQQKDPLKELRGMGMWGLRQLVYFSGGYKKDWKGIVGASNKAEEAKQYRVAIAGIEISDLLFQLFEIGKYDREEEKVFFFRLIFCFCFFIYCETLFSFLHSFPHSFSSPPYHQN